MTRPMLGDMDMIIFDAQVRMPPIITIGRIPKRSARIPAKGPEKIQILDCKYKKMLYV